jgi:hypothetical protein
MRGAPSDLPPRVAQLHGRLGGRHASRSSGCALNPKFDNGQRVPSVVHHEPGTLPRGLVLGRELLNLECDFPHSIRERFDLCGEFSDREGGRCRRQKRVSPFKRRLTELDQLVHRSIKGSVGEDREVGMKRDPVKPSDLKRPESVDGGARSTRTPGWRPPRSGLYTLFLARLDPRDTCRGSEDARVLVVPADAKRRGSRARTSTMTPARPD